MVNLVCIARSPESAAGRLRAAWRGFGHIHRARANAQRFSASGSALHRAGGSSKLPPVLRAASAAFELVFPTRQRAHRALAFGGRLVDRADSMSGPPPPPPPPPPPGSVGAPAQDAPQALLWVGGSSIELTPCRAPLRACRGSRHRPETTPAATRRDAAPRRAYGHL
eukprot:tig00021043_g17616.t1